MNFVIRGLEEWAKKTSARLRADQKEAEKRMGLAINIVYQTARAKRPDVYLRGSERITGITKAKARKTRGIRIVSDPNASFGVPVRTGNLKDSIGKRIFPKVGGGVRGEVYVDLKRAPYGKFVEYGTSAMAPRPFIRPALDLNLEAIKRIFNKPKKE